MLSNAAIGVAVHKDLLMLIKEYARQGHEQTESDTNENFESLWREAFQITESESVLPGERPFPHFQSSH